MFFDGSFFLKDSVNSLISICFSDLKDQELPVSAIKTQIDNNRPKILLARRAHKWSRQLACSNYGPNGTIGTSANVKSWFLWNISKSDQWFLRTRFFCTIQTWISSCLYTAKSPRSPEPYLLTDQNFANNFRKGSPKEHSCEIISKSDLRFWRKKFFKNFFMSI